MFSISEKRLSPSVKSVLEKGLNFCPQTPGYNKLKLTDDLFWLCRNLRLTQERTDIFKQLKNRSLFHLAQYHCDKLNQYIPSIKNGIINLRNKKYINRQQNISVGEKLAIKLYNLIKTSLSIALIKDGK